MRDGVSILSAQYFEKRGVVNELRKKHAVKC